MSLSTLSYTRPAPISLTFVFLEREFDINFKEYFGDALEALQEFVEAELVTITENKIQVSQTGTMLIRNISMPLDAYLNNIPEDKRRFSKTI